MANNRWKIKFFDEEIRKEYEDHFRRHPEQTQYKAKFEKEVTTDPYYHPKQNRIKPLKGKENKGKYRWSVSNTRVIYIPTAESSTIYPIETGTATDISYKKKSRKL